MKNQQNPLHLMKKHLLSICVLILAVVKFPKKGSNKGKNFTSDIAIEAILIH